MEKKRPSVPKGLWISALVLFALGLLFLPAARMFIPPEELTQNIFLNAVPFLLIFVSIILAFITLIWAVASVLNGNISAQVYKPIERVIIGGILLGIFFMFQPWWFAMFKIGFLLLLVSTLSFILWSHVVPKGAHQVEMASLSVSEFEQHSAS